MYDIFLQIARGKFKQGIEKNQNREVFITNENKSYEPEYCEDKYVLIMFSECDKKTSLLNVQWY